MNDFLSRQEEERFQTEWNLLNLIRELRAIATKGATPTYFESIKLARQIAPEIFDDKSLIVKRHHEPELVRSYRQQAEAETILQGKEVTPLDLIDARIGQLSKLIEVRIEEKDLLGKELRKLKSIRSLFLPLSLSEDFILAQDVKSRKFNVEPINIAAKHSDYQVSENRMIRVRLLHPDMGEQMMGADLIYEQYDSEKKKVRFVMIQYKVWDGKTLYWSQAKNLELQILKMKGKLCLNNYCLSESGELATGEFRYPYCSAFLRPTDRLQYKNSPFTSSGMHIPICQISSVAEETKEGNKVLNRSCMRETSINQKTFENAFNFNQLGSRWMSYDEAEELYQKHKILDNDERIILHAQELEI